VLTTIVVVLVVLSLVGMTLSFNMALINFLLVAAIGVVVFRVMRGRTLITSQGTAALDTSKPLQPEVAVGAPVPPVPLPIPAIESTTRSDVT
jgi:hypothetical protein